MAAAFVTDQGVDFVDDHRVDIDQRFPGLFGRQHQVQRLGRCHQDLWWLSDQLGSFPGRGVTGPQPDPQIRQFVALLASQFENLLEWLLQVAVHVVGQGPQG